MIIDMTAASVLSLLLPIGLRWDHLHGLSGDKLREEGGGKCCEAVLLHYMVNVYFLWRPVFTMLYPASNYFLSQFMQRDSWVLRIPLIRQMTPH